MSCMSCIRIHIPSPAVAMSSGDDEDYFEILTTQLVHARQQLAQICEEKEEQFHQLTQQVLNEKKKYIMLEKQLKNRKEQNQEPKFSKQLSNILTFGLLKNKNDQPQKKQIINTLIQHKPHSYYNLPTQINTPTHQTDPLIDLDFFFKHKKKNPSIAQTHLQLITLLNTNSPILSTEPFKTALRDHHIPHHSGIPGARCEAEAQAIPIWLNKVLSVSFAKQRSLKPFSSLINRGVPPTLRHVLWMEAVGDNMHIESIDLYNSLMERVSAIRRRLFQTSPRYKKAFFYKSIDGETSPAARKYSFCETHRLEPLKHSPSANKKLNSDNPTSDPPAPSSSSSSSSLQSSKPDESSCAVCGGTMDILELDSARFCICDPLIRNSTVIQSFELIALDIPRALPRMIPYCPPGNVFATMPILQSANFDIENAIVQMSQYWYAPPGSRYRTFSTLPSTDDIDALRGAVRDILESFVIYRPDIGYIQGMPYIATVLALVMPSRILRAFTIFTNMILSRRAFYSFYAFDLDVLDLYCSAFEVLLSEKLPRISKMLSEHCGSIHSASKVFLVDWFYTCFSRVLPIPFTLRVWDKILLEGDHMLLVVAVGVLAILEKSLLSAVHADGEESIMILSLLSTSTGPLIGLAEQDENKTDEIDTESNSVSSSCQIWMSEEEFITALTAVKIPKSKVEEAFLIANKIQERISTQRSQEEDLAEEKGGDDTGEEDDIFTQVESGMLGSSSSVERGVSSSGDRRRFFIACNDDSNLDTVTRSIDELDVFGEQPSIEEDIFVAAVNRAKGL